MASFCYTYIYVVLCVLLTYIFGWKLRIESISKAQSTETLLSWLLLFFNQVKFSEPFIKFFM